MILAVAGGKGGAGRSTVALNLGEALGAVVVDADLGMADLPAGRGPDLHDVLAGRAAPEEAVRSGPGDLEVVPCGRSLAGARAADAAALGEAVRPLEGAAEHVLVDCPAGLRADAGAGLAVADACLLVASPRAFALADALRSRALARELDAGLVAVALNRVVDDPPADAVERALGAPVTVVPADPRLGASLTDGPVTVAHPDSAAARPFEELAAAVRACEAAQSGSIPNTSWTSE